MKPRPALHCVLGPLLLSVTENLSEQEFHLMLKHPRILEGHYLLKQVSACTQLIKYEIYEQLYATHYLLETNFQLAFIH